VLSYRILFVVSVLSLLCGCATGPTALEPQKGAQNQRSARLYFLRQDGFFSMGSAARIRVNGKAIGSITNGSYIVVDRPAGSYTLSVDPGIDFGSFEVDVQVSEGASYYYEVGPRHYAPAQDLALRLAAKNVGQPMQGRGFMGGVYFNSLDATTGAAEIAKLKKG
jgi:hypothetical protein